MDNEREEGEIFDDDFEDISDSSIVTSPKKSGKLLPRKDHLRDLSLSSISDTDVRRNESYDDYHRKKLRRRRISNGSRKRKKLRKRSRDGSDSDDVHSINKMLLKEAVRLDTSQEAHRNSLRTRLKGMSTVDMGQNVKENGLETKTKADDNDNDEELIELRLEALKTAVMNKFQLRKKNKAMEQENVIVISDSSPKSDVTEKNKENFQSRMNNVTPKSSLVKQNGANEQASDDDEDVLRALLLASMSKKITQESSVGVKMDAVQTKTGITVLNKTRVSNPRVLVKNNQNKIVRNVPKFKPRPMLGTRVIKPMIISFESDSDSDEEEIVKKTEPPKTNANNLQLTPETLQSTVDKFLKEQRAEVEAKLKETSTPLAQTRKEFTAKSVVRLLPKNKQIEYQTLLQRLNNAQGRPRQRKVSVRAAEIKSTIVKRKWTAKVPESIKVVEEKEDKVELQKALKDIQTKQNGRLQIKGKYQVLKPLMNKITVSSQDRKKCEMRVKQLLAQLNDARTELARSQETFSGLVQNLIARKDVIDKSAAVSLKSTNKVYIKPSPVKTNNAQTAVTLVSNVSVQPDDCAPKMDDKGTTIEKAAEDPPPAVNVQKNFVVDCCPDNISDPSDIIFKRPNLSTFSAVPEYVSPLDTQHRDKKFDPLGIMCPYELNGSCRDAECKFNHYN